MEIELDHIQLCINSTDSTTGWK